MIPAQLEPREVDTTCSASTFTAPDGLQFEVFCNQSLNAGIDGGNFGVTTEASWEGCMTTCSWSRPRCYSVTFNREFPVSFQICFCEAGAAHALRILPSVTTFSSLPHKLWLSTHLLISSCSHRRYLLPSTPITCTTESLRLGSCWLKNMTNTVKSAVGGAHSAIVTPGAQLAALNTTCPYANNSMQISSGGLEFKIDCRNDQPYGDYVPTGDDYGIHTDTLEECMEKCTEAIPLCRLLTWDPSQISGYANCYLKDHPGGLPAQPEEPLITHSAFAQLDATSVNTTCPTNTTFVSATNLKTFNINCNQYNDGSNATAIHTKNVNSCMDKCAANSTCVGVAFDSLLGDGFQNCHLKTAIGVSSSVSSYFFATLSGRAPNSTSPSSSSHKKSQGWIAGPVVGAVVALAIIAALVWCWRRRKNSATSRQGGSDNLATQSVASPYYQPVAQDQGPHEMEQAKAHRPPYEMESAGLQHELHGNQRNE